MVMESLVNAAAERDCTDVFVLHWKFRNRKIGNHQNRVLRKDLEDESHV